MSGYDALLDYASCTHHVDGTGIVAELESQVAGLTGFARVLSMSSASTALAAVYGALGLARGDEVIVPAMVPPDTVAPLLRRGCVLVLADVEHDTVLLNPDAVRACLTSRTRGVVGVDLFGQAHDTAALRAIADAAGIAYVADCAQGFGARRDQRPTGYAADGVVLSLNAQKDWAAGEGGLLLTNNPALYEHALRGTQHPSRQARELGNDTINLFPLNGRMNPLAAAAALTTLPGVLATIVERRRRAPALIAAINASGLATTPAPAPGCEPTWPRLIIEWPDTPQPVELLTQLGAAGFSARLRDLPVQPLDQLPGLAQYAHQVRIPHALVNAHRARRSCVEVAWP